MLRRPPTASNALALKHIGYRTVTDSEAWLLDVDKACEPNELFRVIRALREAIYPEELDKDRAKGIYKQDLQVNAVPAGFVVTGFLSTVVGHTHHENWHIR